MLGEMLITMIWLWCSFEFKCLRVYFVTMYLGWIRELMWVGPQCHTGPMERIEINLLAPANMDIITKTDLFIIICVYVGATVAVVFAKTNRVRAILKDLDSLLVSPREGF